MITQLQCIVYTYIIMKINIEIDTAGEKEKDMG